VFKNQWFTRFADKESISNEELKDISSQLEGRNPDADLGCGVCKVRVARPGAGKSGGYRIIVFFRSCDKTFFHYAYSKSSRDNINEKELRVFKRLSKRYLAMTNKQLTAAVKDGEFNEI
jgi:hypothetical protein